MSGDDSSVARLAYKFQIVFFVLLLLYFGQGLFVPLAFGGLISLLLIPLCNFFEKQGFPRLYASLISVILGLLFFVIVSYYISSQIISFKNDLPLIAQRLTLYIQELQQWVVTKFKVTESNVQDFVDSTTGQILSNTSILVSTTFFTLSRVLFIVLIVPVYIFLIMLYRSVIVNFIVASFERQHDILVKDILIRTRGVVKGYIIGLFIETIIVAVMLWIGFIILGVKYAILLALISALLKLIPYLGIVTACVFTMLVTLTTNSMGTVTGVLIVQLVVHLIDGNFLFPAIVGSKVRMNALATIVGVLTGSAIWGIPGMFLAIPILATLKVIFDSLEPFHHWAILLGDDPKIPTIKNRHSPWKKLIK